MRWQAVTTQVPNRQLGTGYQVGVCQSDGRKFWAMTDKKGQTYSVNGKGSYQSSIRAAAVFTISWE